jgi:prevent-host-death family protein
MVTVPIFEAKTRLSELLVQAQQGEEIVITRHGVPMARLMPLEEQTRRGRKAMTQRRQVESVFDALEGLRQGVNLDIPVRSAIEAGRD